jgi:quinol monooxygenase YgiN
MRVHWCPLDRHSRTSHNSPEFPDQDSNDIATERNDHMITLIASLTFKPGEGRKFEATFPEKAAKIRSEEPNVISYKLCRIRGATDRYRMVEVYLSQEALDHHMEKLRTSPSTLTDVLDEPPQIEILDDAPGSIQPR